MIFKPFGNFPTPRTHLISILFTALIKNSCLCSASSTNASKESLPIEPAPNTLKDLSEKPASPGKEAKEKHDDFGDLMDYIMLDSAEREKHRVEIDRVHPVIQKSPGWESLKVVGNPTIGELRKIAVRLVTYRVPVMF